MFIRICICNCALRQLQVSGSIVQAIRLGCFGVLVASCLLARLVERQRSLRTVWNSPDTAPALKASFAAYVWIWAAPVLGISSSARLFGTQQMACEDCGAENFKARQISHPKTVRETSTDNPDQNLVGDCPAKTPPCAQTLA